MYMTLKIYPEHFKKYTIFEFIGIFGGIISIYFKIQTYLGKGCLFILNKIKIGYDMDTISLEMFPGYYEDVGLPPTPPVLNLYLLSQIEDIIRNHQNNSHATIAA